MYNTIQKAAVVKTMQYYDSRVDEFEKDGFSVFTLFLITLILKLRSDQHPQAR